jgi:hypothetical protein
MYPGITSVSQRRGGQRFFLKLSGNTRKTVAVSSARPESLREFLTVWRRAAAPFALSGNTRKTVAV